MSELIKQFKKFIPFAKLDADKREVYGLVTSEAPDSDGEICDYKTTKPFYEKWSEGFQKATDGKSLGNVREMHQNIAAGKVVHLEFDDAAKQIWAVSKIVDDSTWNKCAEGVLTGYSHGGRYEGDPWADGEHRRYTANPTEISVVDVPANPEALFEYVKNGKSEMRKFADLSKKKKTKRVGGKDLGEESFAYVGDSEDTSTWKLPIHDAAHVRNALARFNQTKGIPEGEKSKVYARIVAAAKKFGVEVSEKAAKAISEFASKHMQKGMYEVGRFAEILQGLYWLAVCSESEREWEGDDSDVPEELRGHIEELCSTFEEMTTEEVKELIQTLTATGGAKELYMADQITDLAKAKAHSLAAHFKKGAAFHEKMAAQHASHAEHLHKMAQACSEEDGEKCKALAAEIEKSVTEPEVAKTVVTGQPNAADVEKRAAEVAEATATKVIAPINEMLKKLLSEPEPAKVAKTETAAVTKTEDNGGAKAPVVEMKPKEISGHSEMFDAIKTAKPVENARIPSC